MWPSDLYTKLFKDNWEVQILKLWAEHKAAMWILLFKTVLKSHAIKSSVVRECIKERLLTLSTAVTGLNPWEENSEFSMQKVCWGTIPGSTTGGGREEYRLGQRNSIISHKRHSGSSGALEPWPRAVNLCHLVAINPSCTVPLEGSTALKEMASLHWGHYPQRQTEMWVPGSWRTCL